MRRNAYPEEGVLFGGRARARRDSRKRVSKESERVCASSGGRAAPSLNECVACASCASQPDPLSPGDRSPFFALDACAASPPFSAPMALRSRSLAQPRSRRGTARRTDGGRIDPVPHRPSYPYYLRLGRPAHVLSPSANAIFSTARFYVAGLRLLVAPFTPLSTGDGSTDEPVPNQFTPTRSDFNYAEHRLFG